MIVNCFKVRSDCRMRIWKTVCVHSTRRLCTHRLGDILERDPKICAGFLGLFRHDECRSLIL